jgi:hypothetical protein
MMRNNAMGWPLEFGIFVVSITAGLVLGGLMPEGLPPRSWRLPISALLIVAGLALAVVALL